jgi:hypothetical protein
VGLAPPNAVDIVRWRKCGVLRWLVSESFVRRTGSFSALQITCLLLASIEFDDLQTAQWLVEECGTRLLM